MRTMNTERLFKVTAADMSGNVIEWYVEPGPGKLAYFTDGGSDLEKPFSVHRPHASSSFDKLQSWLRHDVYCQV